MKPQGPDGREWFRIVCEVDVWATSYEEALKQARKLVSANFDQSVKRAFRQEPDPVVITNPETRMPPAETPTELEAPPSPMKTASEPLLDNFDPETPR